jgi:hypothetical protein
MSQTVSSGRRDLAHFVRCHGHGFSGFNPGIDPWVVFVELMYLVGGLVLRAVSFGVMRAAPSDVPYRDFNWFWGRAKRKWADRGRADGRRWDWVHYRFHLSCGVLAFFLTRARSSDCSQ